jgi:hypothetical protein
LGPAGAVLSAGRDARRLTAQHGRVVQPGRAEAAARVTGASGVTFQRVTGSSTNEDGLHALGLHFGDPRVTAVFSALGGFCFLLTGFTNGQRVQRVSALLNATSGHGGRRARSAAG